MPRFRNLRTGAVVNVEAMPTWDEWESLETPALPGAASPADPIDPVVPEIPETVPTVTAPAASPADPERPHNGASRKAWAAYAESLGVDPATMTRGELIAAVDAL